MIKKKHLFTAMVAAAALAITVSGTVLAEGERDFPVSIMKVSTNAQEQSEGPIAGILDGNLDTYFHSAYTKDIGSPHYIEVDLGELKDVAGIRFLPRQSNTSNCPTDCLIEGSVDGNTWFTIIDSKTSGTAPKTEWRECAVDYASQYARYVRFTVKDTQNHATGYNGNDIYFAVSEFRVMKSKTRPVNNAAVSEITSYSAVIQWNSPYPAGDIVKYNVLEDGVVRGVVEEAGTEDQSHPVSFRADNLTASTSYKYTVVSVDADGRESAPVEVSFQTIEAPKDTEEGTDTPSGGNMGNPEGNAGIPEQKADVSQTNNIQLASVPKQAPKTGDNNTAFPVIAILLSGASAVFVYRKLK